MPSTRRNKAKGRRFRDACLMSDYENMDIMLGSPNYYNLDEDGNKDRRPKIMKLGVITSRKDVFSCLLLETLKEGMKR